MAVYAFIANGVVSNAIDTTPEIAAAQFPDAIRVDTLNPQPGIGWAYANGTFTAPPPSTPPAPSNPVFAKPDFMNLFTMPELITCFGFQGNAGLSTDQKNALNIFFMYFQNAPNVDMTHSQTTQGLQLLESCGLLTAGRAAQILAARN